MTSERTTVTPQTLIERFCRLQALVMEEILHFESANDCFCGERQDWVDGGHWMNEQTSIEWIEQVVVEAIARAKRDP